MVTLTNASGIAYKGRDCIISSVQNVMQAEGLIGRIDIILVTDREIKKLHKQWFNDPTVTDVITFPIEPEPPILGEIYISAETARRQASDHNVTLQNELCRLAVHGALHLAGYTDKTISQRTHMQTLENTYIACQ